MVYERTLQTNATDNIVLYVDDFDTSTTIDAPVFAEGAVPDITGYDAEATIFVSDKDFRSLFQVLQYQNDNDMLFRTTVGDTNVDAFNINDPQKANFVDINPAKANVLQYAASDNLDAKFNGSNTLGLNTDILSSESNDLISTGSTYFKVCHDYVRHMAKSLTGLNETDSRTFTNRNALIADILLKGQKSIVDDLFQKMKKLSTDYDGNTLEADGKEVQGYDIANGIYTQIQLLNPARLVLAGEKLANGDISGGVKHQLYNSKDTWQPIPLINGDVVCFKYTFEDISGVNIDNTTIDIPSRTYLIKMCLVDKETTIYRNIETKVTDFDAIQIVDDDTPTDDHEIIAFYKNNSNVQGLINTITESPIKTYLNSLFQENVPDFLNYLRKEQFVNSYIAALNTLIDALNEASESLQLEITSIESKTGQVNVANSTGTVDSIIVEELTKFTSDTSLLDGYTIDENDALKLTYDQKITDYNTAWDTYQTTKQTFDGAKAAKLRELALVEYVYLDKSITLTAVNTFNYYDPETKIVSAIGSGPSIKYFDNTNFNKGLVTSLITDTESFSNVPVDININNIGGVAVKNFQFLVSRTTYNFISGYKFETVDALDATHYNVENNGSYKVNSSLYLNTELKTYLAYSLKDVGEEVSFSNVTQSGIINTTPQGFHVTNFTLNGSQSITADALIQDVFDASGAIGNYSVYLSSNTFSGINESGGIFSTKASIYLRVERIATDQYPDLKQLRVEFTDADITSTVGSFAYWNSPTASKLSKVTLTRS